jgi:hypothetical protein
MWTDSWAYWASAWGGFPESLSPDKPIGYPLLLIVLSAGTKSMLVLTSLQHLAGLAGGALVYRLLRDRTSRVIAAVAAAVVLLDGYAIALEQHILTEAFFTLALVVFAVAALTARDRIWMIVLAGAALAVAAFMREAALFVLPVWIVYCAWSLRPLRTRALAGVLAAIVPVLAGAAVHSAAAGNFGMTELDGWQLYARAAELADCRRVDVPADLRRLCIPRAANPGSRDVNDFYKFSPSSPATRVFGNVYAIDRDRRRVVNKKLRRFAMAVIRERPLDFAGLVAGDALRLFEPGAMAPQPGYDDPIELPADPRPLLPRFRAIRAELASGYDPPARFPAGPLAAYGRAVHTPRPLIGALLLLALLALTTALRPGGRPRPRHTRETFLLAGAGLAIVGAGALNHFEVRYLVPAVPLIVSAGALAAHDLAALVRSRRAPAPGAPV